MSGALVARYLPNEPLAALVCRGVWEGLAVHAQDLVPGLQLLGGWGARLDGANAAVVLLQAEGDGEQNHERQQDVHRRSRTDDDDPLPDGLVVVSALRHVRRQRLTGSPCALDLLHHPRPRVGGAALGLDLVGIHAGDLHEASEGQGPDSVLGLPPLDAHELRREEQEEAHHAHAGRLRGDEVPELVDDDQEHETGDGDHPRPSARKKRAHGATPAVWISSRARSRASASTA